MKRCSKKEAASLVRGLAATRVSFALLLRTDRADVTVAKSDYVGSGISVNVSEEVTVVAGVAQRPAVRGPDLDRGVEERDDVCLVVAVYVAEQSTVITENRLGAPSLVPAERGARGPPSPLPTTCQTLGSALPSARELRLRFDNVCHRSSSLEGNRQSRPEPRCAG